MNLLWHLPCLWPYGVSSNQKQRHPLTHVTQITYIAPYYYWVTHFRSFRSMSTQHIEAVQHHFDFLNVLQSLLKPRNYSNTFFNFQNAYCFLITDISFPEKNSNDVFFVNYACLHTVSYTCLQPQFFWNSGRDTEHLMCASGRCLTGQRKRYSTIQSLPKDIPTFWENRFISITPRTYRESQLVTELYNFALVF